MNILPAGVTGPMAATGGVAPFSLLEVQTLTETNYFFSEQDIYADSIITTQPSEHYLPWLTGVPSFHLYRSLQTNTCTFNVQNVSGNTVKRDVATILSADEFIGAMIYYRLWKAGAEISVFDFLGNVIDATIDEQNLRLTVDGFGDWSSVKAPFARIDVGCPLFFKSMACSSVSSVPCNNTYGTCSSLQRFAGVVLQWNDGLQLLPSDQFAQPAPVQSYNPRRAV